jgi:hypothetical protein
MEAGGWVSGRVGEQGGERVSREDEPPGRQRDYIMKTKQRACVVVCSFIKGRPQRVCVREMVGADVGP